MRHAAFTCLTLAIAGLCAMVVPAALPATGETHVLPEMPKLPRHASAEAELKGEVSRWPTASF